MTVWAERETIADRAATFVTRHDRDGADASSQAAARSSWLCDQAFVSKAQSRIDPLGRKDNPHKTEDRRDTRMSTTINVEGMSCEHCEQTVEEALRGVGGVTDATADREAEQASVDGDADPDALVQAVEDAGYTASA